jgi:hypothetical protein
VQDEMINTCTAVLCGSSLSPVGDKAELCAVIQWQNHLLLSIVYCNKTTARKGGNFFNFPICQDEGLRQSVTPLLTIPFAVLGSSKWTQIAAL